MKHTKQLFETFITQNLDNIYRFAFSYMKNKEATEDVVNDSILKALSNLDSLRYPEFIKTWFYRIVINTSLSCLEKNKKIIYFDSVMLDETQSTTDTYQDTDLTRLIFDLDEKYRTVIILHYFEDMKLSDIASILGLNISTVKSRLYRALELLKLQAERIQIQ